MNKSSFRTSFNKIRFSADLPSVGIYVYVGVSPSFSVFLEATTIIVVTPFSPISRFSRSTVTLSEYVLSFLYSFRACRCAGFRLLFQASASFREGIIALYTLLSFIFLPYPYGALPNSLFSSLVWLCFMSSSVHPLFL